MITSKISSKGQTTLPRQVRQALGVEAGDRVCYFVYDNEVRVKPMRPIGHLFGALKHEGPPLRLEDMERGIVEGACDGSAPAPADDLQADSLAAESTAAVMAGAKPAASLPATLSPRRSSPEVVADAKLATKETVP